MGKNKNSCIVDGTVLLFVKVVIKMLGIYDTSELTTAKAPINKMRETVGYEGSRPLGSSIYTVQ
jgi:hypothetical protein